MLSYLLLSLISCSTKSYIDSPVKVPPPQIRLEKTLHECKAKTNEELLNCYIQLQYKLDSCNMDKQAIRDFYSK